MLPILAGPLLEMRTVPVVRLNPNFCPSKRGYYFWFSSDQPLEADEPSTTSLLLERVLGVAQFQCGRATVKPPVTQSIPKNLNSSGRLLF